MPPMTKKTQTPKVGMVSLGCPKAASDSEGILTRLRAEGYDIVGDYAGADLVVVNTCGFIDSAVEESLSAIGEALSENGKVIVTGCLGAKKNADGSDLITSIHPKVLAVTGPHATAEVLQAVHTHLPKPHDPYVDLVPAQGVRLTPSHYAYLKIAEGCDRPCSFCAIPLMRGGHVSRPMDELVKEASSLAKKGTKELILIAQDLTFYGLDLKGEGKSGRQLKELLERLSDVQGIEWIRLQYAYPAGFPMEILQTMAERDNICKYLDMPLQSGSDAMLKHMRRGITREKTEQLITDIREKVPGIALRTTLISGYPGETDADFEETYSFVERMRFDRLGIFNYSHEENTHAYLVQDDVPEEVKQERSDEIMALQQGISEELNQAKIGQTFKVMVDRKESGFFVGRTEHDSPEVDNEVLIPAEQFARQGDFVQVKINKAEEFDLYGDIVS